MKQFKEDIAQGVADAAKADRIVKLCEIANGLGYNHISRQDTQDIIKKVESLLPDYRTVQMMDTKNDSLFQSATFVEDGVEFDDGETVENVYKYIVVDEETYGDSWTETYDTLEEANREAKYTWELLTDLERRNRKVYVMRSLGEPDDMLSNLEDVEGAFYSDHHVLREQAYDVADSLYGGGWRAADKDDLKAEYGFDDESLERVCDFLAEMEKESEEDDE